MCVVRGRSEEFVAEIPYKQALSYTKGRETLPLENIKTETLLDALAD